MDFLLQFVLVSFPILFLIYFLLKAIKNKSRLYAPGPFGLPFIGNLHQIDNKNLLTSLSNLSKSYGPIVSLRFGFIPAIVVSSASLAKEVLKTQDIIFCSRPPLQAQQKLSYSGLDVAFSPYNKYWSEMRKIMTIHLLSQKRVQSYRYIREDEVVRAMNKIHGLALSSNHVNLSELSKSVTNNIITRMSFGKRYEGHESKKILGLLDDLQATITNFFISDNWPGLAFTDLIDRLTGKMGQLEKCFQNLDTFYQELIEEHLKPQNLKSHEEEQAIVDVLIELMKNPTLNTFKLTYNHIKAMLMNILVAGTDTNAATIIWAMATLIKNPKVMKKAQEEVESVVGRKKKVDEDDLPKLVYLRAVIKEVMRLYPPAPLLVPRETRKVAILHGYKIKPKTLVFVNAWAIGRDPKSWENPTDFLPERFLGSNIDFKGNDFELIPFGAGRRICPGMSTAIVTVELILANLLYLFDWGLPDGTNNEDIDFEAKPGLTMYKKNDLYLIAYVHS